MNEELRKTAGLRDCRTVGRNKSGVWRVERISGRHLCRIATKLSRLSVAHKAKFSERGGNPRQSEELSKAILDKFHHNRLCKGLFTTHHSLLTNKKAAFTLAETLITLGVIGVVAAITMPTLIKNYQKHVWTNQLKSTYSILQNGFKMMLAQEGVMRLSDTSVFQSIGGAETTATNSTRTYRMCKPHCNTGHLSNSENCKDFYQKLKKYFKIISIDDIENNNDAAINAGMAYKYLNMDDDYYKRQSVTRLNLSNGVSIIPERFWSSTYKYLDDGKEYPFGGNVGIFYIDLNGKKGPNIFGRDMFMFYISDNGTLIPCGSMNFGLLLKNDADYYYWKTTVVQQDKCAVIETTEGYGCAARVLEEGKMNY